MIAAGECGKCGQEHGRCHAHVYRPDDGGTRPCGAYPIRGGTVCPVHGGMAPQTQAKASRVLAEREAAALAQATYPRRRPTEILLDALHRADALAQQALVEDWPDADVLVQRASSLAQVALSRDLEATEARISQEQAKELAGLMRRTLDQLELTDEQWRLLPAVVREELRVMRVPEPPALRRALTSGSEAPLTQRQAQVVADTWRRAVAVLELDEAALERASAVFVAGCSPDE